MVYKDLVVGISLETTENLSDRIDCECCAEKKLTRGPLKGRIDSAKEIGDVINSALVGLLPATKAENFTWICFLMKRLAYIQFLY